MTSKEYLDYHEDKINRLYEEYDRIQEYIHKATEKSINTNAATLLDFVKQLYAIELNLISSLDIRSTLINIESYQRIKTNLK